MSHPGLTFYKHSSVATRCFGSKPWRRGRSERSVDILLSTKRTAEAAPAKVSFVCVQSKDLFHLRVDMDLRGSNLFASGSSMPCCVLVLSRRESFQFVLSLKGSAISFLEFCFFRLFLESCLGRLIGPCFSFCKESQIDLAAPPPIPVPIPA